MRATWTKRLWIALTVVVIGFTSYAIIRNLVHIFWMRGQLRDMRREAKLYRAQIEADSTLIEHLRYDDLLEEYAREHYRMQRHDEEVFILEE